MSVAEFELELHARLIMENALRETPGRLWEAKGHLARAAYIARQLERQEFRARLVLESIAVSGLLEGMDSIGRFFSNAMIYQFRDLDSYLTGEYLGRLVEHQRAQGQIDAAWKTTTDALLYADHERPAKQSAHFFETFSLRISSGDHEGASSDLARIDALLQVEPHDYYRMLYWERRAELAIEVGDAGSAESYLRRAKAIQTSRAVVSRSARTLSQRLQELAEIEGFSEWTH